MSLYAREIPWKFFDHDTAANTLRNATAQFEIGDVNLDEETSLGLDISFRKTAGRLRGQINLFNNSFDGFIFDAPTGQEEDGFPGMTIEFDSSEGGIGLNVIGSSQRTPSTTCSCAART